MTCDTCYVLDRMNGYKCPSWISNNAKMMHTMSTQSKLPKPVQGFLTEKHFTLQATLKNSRYFLMRVATSQADIQLMLKIEKSNPRTSLQQRNHILWTKSVAHTVPQNAPFHIVPILEDGYLEGVGYWFTMPFIEGQSFAAMNDDRLSAVTISHPEEVMPRIVSLIKYIEKTPALSVDGIDARYGKIPNRRDKLTLLETAISWARNDTPYLAELLQLIQANYAYLGSANAHGDFTESNLIINQKREPVLIDAEISSAFHYKYYDVAEFYNRLFTRACAPELAATFLREYVHTLPQRSVQKFLTNFLCLSALRCIGNFMEIAALPEGIGKQKRLEYANRYATTIVTYDILQFDTQALKNSTHET